MDSTMMEEILSEISNLNNYMESFRKMLQCVFEVSLISYDDIGKLLMDTSNISSCLDDIKGGVHVQVGRVEDMMHRVQKLEILEDMM